MDISSIAGMMGDVDGDNSTTTYLCKFDEEGHRKETYLACEYSDEQKQEMFNKGYVEISQEDWNYYVGNEGEGDNGTGYIRDAATGKPVSAPPYVPTKEELANNLYYELQNDLNELNSQISDAQIDGDSELVEELRQEKEDRIAQYAADIEALEEE